MKREEKIENEQKDKIEEREVRGGGRTLQPGSKI